MQSRAANFYADKDEGEDADDDDNGEDDGASGDEEVGDEMEESGSEVGLT